MEIFRFITAKVSHKFDMMAHVFMQKKPNYFDGFGT